MNLVNAKKHAWGQGGREGLKGSARAPNMPESSVQSGCSVSGHEATVLIWGTFRVLVKGEEGKEGKRESFLPAARRKVHAKYGPTLERI